jgi:hypothetical protein
LAFARSTRITFRNSSGPLGSCRFRLAFWSTSAAAGRKTVNHLGRELQRTRRAKAVGWHGYRLYGQAKLDQPADSLGSAKPVILFGGPGINTCHEFVRKAECASGISPRSRATGTRPLPTSKLKYERQPPFQPPSLFPHNFQISARLGGYPARLRQGLDYGSPRFGWSDQTLFIQLPEHRSPPKHESNRNRLSPIGSCPGRTGNRKRFYSQIPEDAQLPQAASPYLCTSRCQVVAFHLETECPPHHGLRSSAAV